MEKPIITTDMPGCREVVEEGKNGYLCTAKDPEDLARTMIRLIKSSAPGRLRMGRYGRRKMQRQFDEVIVLEQYHAAIKGILKRGKSKCGCL
jgi:glycosyltransferase involved in cell wall biosynthesis